LGTLSKPIFSSRWSALRSLVEQVFELAGPARTRVKAFRDANRSQGLLFCFFYGFAILLEKDWPESSRALFSFLVKFFPDHFALLVRYASLLMRNGETQAGEACYLKALEVWSRSPERVSPVRLRDFVEAIRGLRPLAEIEASLVSAAPGTVEALHLGLELMARFGLVDALETVLARNRSLLGGSQASVRVLDVRDIRQDAGATLQELFPARPYTFREPPVFGEPDTRPERTVEAPACWLGSVTDVKVMGGFTVVRDDELIVYEPAAHPRHDIVAGCWEYVTPVYGGEKQALMWYPFERETRLDEGILLSGRCSTNYFHWLIEYLPKGFALESRPELKHIPLIVDASMPPQHFESLRVVMGEWPLHVHHPSTLLHVGKLWLASTPTYHPDRFDLPYWVGSAVSEPHLDYLRQRALEKMAPGPQLPKNIYLSRRGYRGRKIRNERELEKELARARFTRVRPETLGFLEQVRLFHNADVIAGPGGAAMSNLLFCRPGAKVLALTGERNKTYSMHANLARKAGARFLYVAGAHLLSRASCASEAEYAFSTFEVPSMKVNAALAELMDAELKR
jgi:capsular polysaccharide biosynthesis protein